VQISEETSDQVGAGAGAGAHRIERRGLIELNGKAKQMTDLVSPCDWKALELPDVAG
jgi:hypothetical protein